jgi:hypothetical protein
MTCAGAKCGEVVDNCGQEVDCGGCPPEICQTATCSASDHHCHYTAEANGTTCATGVCREGQCVAIECRANDDCQPAGNTCLNGLCVCGAGAACNGSSEHCCADSPGGICWDTADPHHCFCANIASDPNHCGECGGLCEGSVCVAVSCVDGQCQSRHAPDNRNPGGFCPGSEVCCSGACTDVEGNVDHCGTCGHHCANPTPVCIENGNCVACQADTQCPPDQTCCNGDCIDGCRPTFCHCEHDDQCCHGACEGGGPVSYYCCLELFESCTSGSECCTGVCESGLCG